MFLWEFRRLGLVCGYVREENQGSSGKTASYGRCLDVGGGGGWGSLCVVRLFTWTCVKRSVKTIRKVWEGGLVCRTWDMIYGFWLACKYQSKRVWQFSLHEAILGWMPCCPVAPTMLVHPWDAVVYACFIPSSSGQPGGREGGRGWFGGGGRVGAL